MPSVQTVEESAAFLLQDITKRMPVAKRLEVETSIRKLQKLVNSTDDLFIDYRTVKPRMSAEKLEARAEAKANTYLVSFMGTGSVEQCTLEEAAKLVRLSPMSLRGYVSKNIWYSRTTDNEFGNTDIAEVCRCHSNGEPRVPKQEFLKKRQEELGKKKRVY